MEENFDKLINRIADVLSDNGTNIKKDEYDGIYILKLKDSNIIPANKTSNNRQTHIAITGSSKYLFPVLSSWWQGGQDEISTTLAQTLNKYSELIIPIELYTSNLEYLKRSRSKNTDIDNSVDKISTYTYVYSRPSNQIQLSKIAKDKDGEDFLKFRSLLYEGDYIIFLKLKNKFSYSVFGLNKIVFESEPSMNSVVAISSLPTENQVKPKNQPKNIELAFKEYMKKLVSDHTYNLYLKALNVLKEALFDSNITEEFFSLSFLLSLNEELYRSIRGNTSLDPIFKRKDNNGGTNESAVFNHYYTFGQDLIAHGIFTKNTNFIPEKFPYQRILSGAPGTGKSFILNQDREKLFPEDNYERVTFHPRYSYGNFFGSYKPFPGEEKDKITYTFVPGPLLRLIEKAYTIPDENFLLIIEELNRADAGAVFGDVFQLLDRGPDGWSQYPINTSEEVREYFKTKYSSEAYENGRKSILEIMGNNFGTLYLPSNLYIWSTVNPADQGVKPLDSAFKRRWEFEYIGIDDVINEDFDKYLMEIGGQKNSDSSTRIVKWNDLRKEINRKLLDLPTISEDKLIGPYFISKSILESNNPKSLNENVTNKVLLYLYDDVVKGPYKNKFFISEASRNYTTLKQLFNLKGEDVIQGVSPLKSVNENYSNNVKDEIDDLLSETSSEEE